MLQRHCPHRCSAWSFGRIEDGGLRCLYHGWLFDVQGNCIEQPGEPPESKFKDEIKAISYPLREVGGLIFLYMGKGEPPAFPDYEPFRYSDDHRVSRRFMINCNYLQALEGGFDPVHLSYLHRPLKRKDYAHSGSDNKSADNYYACDLRPMLEFEHTDYGIRIYSILLVRPGQEICPRHELCLPGLSSPSSVRKAASAKAIPMHWHVPVDDEHNMRFDLIFQPRSAGR